MKKIIITLLTALFLSACATNDPVQDNSSSQAVTPPANPSSTVTIRKVIPYKKGAMIAVNIKQECQLNTQLSEFIYSFGSANNIAVKRVPKVTKNTKGQYLLVEITNAVSQGNAFIGHRKYTQILGVLYNSGKRVAGFTAARFSGGGFFGNYKGSCSVLGRTVETLGKDVAGWLKSPVDGIHLGDGI